MAGAIEQADLVDERLDLALDLSLPGLAVRKLWGLDLEAALGPEETTALCLHPLHAVANPATRRCAGSVAELDRVTPFAEILGVVLRDRDREANRRPGQLGRHRRIAAVAGFDGIRPAIVLGRIDV